MVTIEDGLKKKEEAERLAKALKRKEMSYEVNKYMKKSMKAF